MYSKPLDSRMDGPREAPVKVKHGVPLGGAVNFASFLPQNSALPGKGLPQSPPISQGQKTGQGPSPLEQTATQGNLGLNQLRAVAALNTVNPAPQGTQTVEALQTQGMPLNPRDLFKLLSQDKLNADTALRVKSHRKGSSSKDGKGRLAETITAKLNAVLSEMRQKSGNPETGQETEVGKLAARFESGKEGISAIGYDRHGGTSYGKYQLSSRAGTVRGFIGYLRAEAPDIAERLEKAGAANTGGKRGTMPQAWKQIAEEHPDRFEELQDRFIRASHFEPAMRAIAEKAGIAATDMPFALQEVVFSTAVQHGPHNATRIISRALGQVGETSLDPEKNSPESLVKAQERLIRRIYDNRSGQFTSSVQSVQAAVKNRLKQEMSLAISMLRDTQTGA